MVEEEKKELIDIGDGDLSSIHPDDDYQLSLKGERMPSLRNSKAASQTPNSRSDFPEDPADFPAVEKMWTKILGDIVDEGKRKQALLRP